MRKIEDYFEISVAEQSTIDEFQLTIFTWENFDHCILFSHSGITEGNITQDPKEKIPRTDYVEELDMGIQQFMQKTPLLEILASRCL